MDLLAVPLEGDRKPQPIVESPFRKGGVAISPDGKWMAYSSDASGREEICAQPFPAGGGKIPISTAGCQHPRWSSSGEIFYLSPSKRLMAVRVATSPTFNAEQPHPLFDTSQYVDANFPYDVTADGQRFLMIKEDNRAAESSSIDLVLNWNRELNRLLPP